MSFTPDDRKHRGRGGKFFPINPKADVEAAFADVIADALRRDFGDTPAHAKHIARLAGTNARTVQNWLQARNGPSGAGLVMLMRHSDQVTAAVLDLTGRAELSKAAKTVRTLDGLRAALLAALDLLDPE
jgi:hypothetical protein